MRIVVVGKYYEPYIGGIETVTKKLCEGLVREGHEVLCLVVHENKYSQSFLKRGSFTLFKKKNYGAVCSTPLSLWRSKEINSFRPDLVHIHLPNPLPLFMLSRIKCKKIATYHASIVNKGWVGQIYNYLYKAQLRNFDHIIVTSKNITKSSRVKSLAIDEKKLTVIPLGVASPEVEPIRNKTSLGKIVFSGRFVTYKGVEYLLRAIAPLKVELTLIGSGPEKKNYLKLIKELNIESKVRLIPSLNKKKLFLELLRHDVFVLPSISEAEAFGLSALEAMTLGLPVITTELNTGTSEVNQHEVTGLVVPPRQVAPLKEAIRLLTSDHRQYHRLAKGARARARDELNENLFLSEHLRLYKNCFYG